MKPSSPALRALLASRQFFVADLYTFSFVGGGVARYCGGDQDIVANGLLYPAGGQIGPYFDRKDNKSKCHWKIGVEVDTLSFDILPGIATLFGSPFLQQCHQGLFDGAEFMLERAFMPTYGDTRAGVLRMFVGRVAEVDCGRSVATFNVNSHLELLNSSFPRNLFQAGCLNNLGDGACGVSLGSYSSSMTALAGSTAGAIKANVTNALLGYYDQGKVVFTGGVNNGISRGIRMCSYGAPGTITLIGPLPGAPAPGDTFTLSAGCDKTSGLSTFTTGNTHSNTTIDGIVDMSGVVPYAVVAGTGIPTNTYVVPPVVSNSITISAAATSTIAGVQLQFLGQNGCGKFANQARYRGFPFVPQPQTAV